MNSVMGLFLPGHDKGAAFPQQVDGREYDRQGEYVAGGGDEGGKQQQAHYGVAAVAVKESAV